MNVLIIDDCSILNDCCYEFLCLANHTVYQATTKNYREVLELHPDIEVVTINMDPCAPEETKAIQEYISGLLPHAHFIIITINYMCSILYELIQKGCQPLILPFNDTTLIELVELSTKGTASVKQTSYTLAIP
jgi:DNA-binding NarL/FixJ family response regulator